MFGLLDLVVEAEVWKVEETPGLMFCLFVLVVLLSPFSFSIVRLTFLINDSRFSKSCLFFESTWKMSIFNAKNNDKMCLFVILNYLWLLNMHSYLIFHILYCRHVWGVSKNGEAGKLPVSSFWTHLFFGAILCNNNLY